MTIVRDGEECLDYLYGRGKFAGKSNEAPPSILILDIKMPRLDGFTVLRKIRADRQFHHLPIIVLTTSRDPADCERSYGLGATAYINKPVEFDDYSRMLASLVTFWQSVTLPEKINGEHRFED